MSPRSHRLLKGKASLIALVVALVIGYLSGLEPRELLQIFTENSRNFSTSDSSDTPAQSDQRKNDSSRQPGTALNGYTRLENCSLVPWGGNDGDSFKVRHAGKTTVFRLYFVDTPESNFRFPDRVGHQARYFKTSREKVVAVGKQAKKFTTSLLAEDNFTVFTRWESVMGSKRMHAFVRTSDGKFLCEDLVARGLARIYTMPADLPDGTSRKIYKQHLKKIEATARQQRLGGWRSHRH